MANLNINSTTNRFEQNVLLTKQNNTIYTLSTTGTYLNKDIQMNMSVRSATVTLAGSASASISSLSFTYNTSANNFTVAGNAAITGTGTASVSQVGWIGNAVSGNISGTATASMAVARIGLGTTLSATSLTKKPVIERTTTTATGAVNVGDAAATTSAPTSGYFVSVKSNANTGYISATPKVTAAGYGTTSYYGATGATATVGASASDITYIPIKSGSATISGTISQAPTISVSSNGYITAAFSRTQSLTPTVTAGWITQGTAGNVTIQGSAGTAMRVLAASNYYPSTEDVTITTAGVYVTGNQVFKAVTTANISAGNIKSGVTVKVGDADHPTSIKNVTGTFTNANTVSTGQTAATATQIISGYSAWVNGAEIKGAIETRSSANINVDSATASWVAGYYPAGYKAIKQGAVNTPATTIAKAPNITIATATGVITAKYSSSASVTPNVSTAGWISSGTAGTITTTGNQTLTLDPPSISVSGRTVTINPGWVKSTTAYSVATTSMSYTNTSVSSNGAVSRGNASWGTGWITSGNVGSALFANSPSDSVTYIDISNTTQAPILYSEGYLYINKGYTDNLKISLAKLIPDDSKVVALAAGHILSGYAAYNHDGTLLSGTIPTYTAANLAISGNTTYVLPGYYATTATIAMTAGAYSASIGLTTVTVTPSVSINNSSTYGFTTTVPSGTNGTNYLTIDPGSNAPTYSATGTASITTAGYLATGSKYAGTSKTVSVAAGTSYYVPVVSPSFSGGGLSGSTTNVITVTGMTTSASATSYYIDAKATGTATRAVINYTNSAGVIAAHSSATAITAAGRDMGSNATRVYIPASSYSISAISGGGVSCNIKTATSCTATTTDTYNSGIAIQFTGSRATATVATTATAGYMPASNKTATLAAGSANSSTYYLQSVKLVAPSSGTRKFDIIVPNGNTTDYITFQFTVDASGNVTVGPP